MFHHANYFKNFKVVDKEADRILDQLAEGLTKECVMGSISKIDYITVEEPLFSIKSTNSTHCRYSGFILWLLLASLRRVRSLSAYVTLIHW